MVAPVVTGGFKIAAEFVFHESATKGLDGMAKKIELISLATDRLQDQLTYLATRTAMGALGFSGGWVGMLTNAFMASEKFKNSQIDIAKVLEGNKDKLTGVETHAKRMKVSSDAIGRLSEMAFESALPLGDLTYTYKALKAMLIPKGVAGDNFKNVAEIARGLMVSAPVLQINPSEVQGQMLRFIEGSTGMGDTLYRRLWGEAREPFAQAGVKNIKDFKGLTTAQRTNLLSKALEKFSRNADLVTERVNTLGGVMRRINLLFRGMDSIFRPFGDLLHKTLIPMVNNVLVWVNLHGRAMIKRFAGVIEGFFDEPEKMIERFYQMRRAGADANAAKNLTKMAFYIGEFFHLMPMITKYTGLKLPDTGILGGIVKGLSKFFKIFAIGSISIKAILFVGAKLVALFAALFTVFQVFSRVAGKLAARRLLFKKEMGERLLGGGLDFAERFAPVVKAWDKFIDTIADAIFNLVWAISVETPILVIALETLVKIVQGVALLINLKFTFFRLLNLIVRSLFSRIYNIFKAIAALDFTALKKAFFGRTEMDKKLAADARLSGYTLGGDLMELLGFDRQAAAFKLFEILEKARQGKDDREVVKNKVQIDQVKINQEFKASQDPDRVAFRVKDVLEKLGNNPTQAAGDSFSGLVRGV